MYNLLGTAGSRNFFNAELFTPVSIDGNVKIDKIATGNYKNSQCYNNKYVEIFAIDFVIVEDVITDVDRARMQFRYRLQAHIDKSVFVVDRMGKLRLQHFTVGARRQSQVCGTQ